jgi:transcriptional regulator with XRE-family HTH domain
MKMTQEDLAKKIGVKRAVISKYETGLISPSADTLQKIANVLNVSMADLLTIDPHTRSAGKPAM